MRFQIGDIVKIAKTSEYYDSIESSHPRDIEGVVEEIDDDEEFRINVEWTNETYNYYNEESLRLVKRN